CEKRLDTTRSMPKGPGRTSNSEHFFEGKLLVDVMTRQQRSRCMSRIRGKDTGPELALRRALWKSGLRFRVHYALPGRPDIAFPVKKVAVFVDGCFWHGCPEHGVKPRSNVHFWADKLKKNTARDQAVAKALEKLGWKIVRFWEHEVE